MRWAPLTEAQEGLWYAQRLDRDNPIFSTGQYLDLRGPLDVKALRAAIAQAVSEAESLALRFIETPHGPRQCVDRALLPLLRVVDLSAEPDPRGAAVRAIVAAQHTPVDLERGPLASEVLYRLGAEHHLWSQRVHHLAVDGYGMALLTDRVAQRYAHAVAGEAEGLPLAPLAPVWDEDTAYRASARRGEDAAYWRDVLAGIDEVAGMVPGRAATAHRVHRVTRAVSPSLVRALQELGAACGAAWPDVVTALVAAYARRFTSEPEVVVGVPFMGRLGSASARAPATVMNVLPLRIAAPDDGPIGAFLASVARTLVRARRRGRYRSEQLRRDLRLLGGERRLYGPLVNVLPFDRVPRLPGLTVERHVTSTGPVDDFTFTLRGDPSCALSLELEANPTLYTEAQAAAHAARLLAFLAAAAHARSLTEVPTATEEEARRERFAHNRTAHPLPDESLAALLDAAMIAHAGAVALRYEGASLDYAALDRHSAAIAATLAARGAGPSTIVAIALPRSIALVVAVFGVLRAGAAYLPLDLEAPRARVAAILDRAAPVAVIAADDPHGLYGSRWLAPTDLAAARARPVRPAPDDAAYVLFTSGSTGVPKGVVVGHRAIVNRLLWMRDHYGFGAHDRILHKTPVTFDVSLWELLLPALSGGTLVIAPPGAQRDPAAIAALIRSEGVTTLHFVPSMLDAFLAAPESAGLAVTRVFASGEALPAALRDRFHRRMRGALHNLYGPTEAAVDVSFHEAGPDDASDPVPIGHPVWNTQLTIRDAMRRPVPPGAVGELYLGGVQLAHGYLGQPELTRERFVPDPYDASARLYATGDRARRRDDGAVVFLGRTDQQVKLRGVRIELGEIEAAIAATRHTQSAAVAVRDDRLVAYVVPTDRYEPHALRAALAQALPAPMVPAAFVALAQLPLTPSGKLDRRALPAPSFASVGGALPATRTERMLAQLVAEVLQRDAPVTASDDFFELGGDSLSALRLLSRIRGACGTDPGLAAIFALPSVARLAAHIDALGDAPAGARDEGLQPLIALAYEDGPRPPLFLVHPAGGICWGYRALARALTPRRTVFGLQAPALARGRAAPTSIDALAEEYASRMIEAAPRGPYHVAGWSVGGIIAQAIGVALLARGREVGLVAMLDAYPAECWRAEPEPTARQALRALLAVAGHDPGAHPELDTRDAILAFLRAGDSALGHLPDEALDGVVRVVLDTNRLVRQHYHRKLACPLLHVRAGSDHAGRPDLDPARWERYAARLDRVTVPFLHPQLTGHAASALIAPALSARMAESEGAHDGPARA